MLLRLLSASLLFFLIAPYSLAGDFPPSMEVNGADKIAPALRARISQEIGLVQPKGQHKTFRLVVSLRPRESIDVLNHAFSTSAGNVLLKRNIRQVQDAVQGKMLGLEQKGFNLLRRYHSLYGFSVEADSQAVLRLITDPEVVYVEEMPVFHTMDFEAFALTCTAPAHSSGWTGKGVTVAVIDDGIDRDHAAFGGFPTFPNAKIVGGYDFADFDNDPGNDCEGQSHGTATAGVAVGNGGGVAGTAPDAGLVFLKVQSHANCGTSVLDGDVIAALDWVITNRYRYNIKVVSMSMGTSATYSSPCSGSVLSTALIAAEKAGLIVVASSGNDSSENSLADPACHPDVVSVGAVYDADLGYAQFRVCADSVTSGDLVPCYSNSADFLDVLAPSHCATTARAGGEVNSCFGGTSASTPYVAGVLATLFEKKQFLSRNEAIDAVVHNGDPVMDWRTGRTTPRVNHSKALNSLDEGNAIEMTPLKNGVSLSGLSDGVHGSKWFCLTVPPEAEHLQFETVGGSGDADMYVRLGAVPTLSLNDCGSGNSGNGEVCSFQAPAAGTYYVMLYGADAYSDLSLQADYRLQDNGSSPRLLSNGQPISELAGAEMTKMYFVLAVPSGAAHLKIQISGGSGDADLHVKYERTPDVSTYDCRPFAPGNNEACTFASPAAGKYYVMIQAYASYAGVTLTGWYDTLEKDGMPAGKVVLAPLLLLLK